MMKQILLAILIAGMFSMGVVNADKETFVQIEFTSTLSHSEDLVCGVFGSLAFDYKTPDKKGKVKINVTNLGDDLEAFCYDNEILVTEFIQVKEGKTTKVKLIHDPTI